MAPERRPPLITIRGLDPRRIDELKPLWLALRDHHGALVPSWGPVRGDEDSWARCRAGYVDTLNGGGLCLVAWAGDAVTAGYPNSAPPVGYAMVGFSAGSPTWAAVDRLAHLDTLSVAPYARGRGVGKLLLDAVRARVAAEGVTRIELTAVAANAGARRFYEREGFGVAFVTMGSALRVPGRPLR